MEIVGNVAFWVFVVGALVLLAGVAVGGLLRANAEVVVDPTPEARGDWGGWSGPVLRDVAHPEHYPKTWAYRAARAEEETKDIMAPTDDPFGDAVARDWYLRSGDPTPDALKLMAEVQRGQHRRINGRQP